MRVVLDTNVILAAYCFGGLCRAVLEVCMDAHELISCEHILSEVNRHLREKFNHSVSEADTRIAVLREVSVLVQPVDVEPDICRDPDDLPVLGAIIAGDADCVVTGDHDLLTLGQFQGRRILSPREFWEHLKQLP